MALSCEEVNREDFLAFFFFVVCDSSGRGLATWLTVLLLVTPFGPVAMRAI